MLGLIIKDLLNMKGQYIIMVVSIVIYGALAYSGQDSQMLGLILMLFAIMAPVSSMALDEKAKWDAYAATMPIKRTCLATSKYLLALGGLVLNMSIYFIISLLLFGMSVEPLFLETMGYMALAMVVQSLMVPITVKFGVEKGRILMMLSFAIPFGAVLVFEKLGLNMAIGVLTTGHYMALALITINLWLLSLKVSQMLYLKKVF